MANYGRLKTMKAAAIGTIIPWTGAITGIPKGWLLCDGRQIKAEDYPLLAQAIGNTYGGSAGFSVASFPWRGAADLFNLPNILQKALMDCSTDYFAGGAVGAVDANIDTAGARTAVGSFIGSDSDVSAPNRVADAYADILFNYTPGTFSGTITGSTFNPGIGTKTVYVGARKLGRHHMQSHDHPTGLTTVFGSTGARSRPGAGVSASRAVSYNIEKAGSDDIDGTATVFIGVGGFPSGSAFRQGDPAYDGTAIGNLNAASSSLAPQNCGSHGIANWIGSSLAPDVPSPFGGLSNTESTPNPGLPKHTRRFNQLQPDTTWQSQGPTCPYALGGGTHATDGRNYDEPTADAAAGGAPPGATGDGTTSDDHKPYKVFFNNPAIDFTKTANSTATIVDTIQPHDHGTFEVRYDVAGSTLRMPGSIASNNVVANVIPDNLPQALNITVDLPTPKVLCMYIIRAY